MYERKGFYFCILDDYDDGIIPHVSTVSFCLPPAAAASVFSKANTGFQGEYDSNIVKF